MSGTTALILYDAASWQAILRLSTLSRQAALSQHSESAIGLKEGMGPPGRGEGGGGKHLDLRLHFTQARRAARTERQSRDCWQPMSHVLKGGYSDCGWKSKNPRQMQIGDLSAAPHGPFGWQLHPNGVLPNA